MEAPVQCKIKMEGLTENAKNAYIFKNMHKPLVSFTVIWYNGCELAVTKQHVQVWKLGRNILTGYREPANKLQRFPNASKPQPSMSKVEPQINSVLTDGTMKDILTFLHKSMVIPTTRTLLKAIGDNNISTWPFMTDSNVRKFLHHSIPTTLVHQGRNRENYQSTTPQPTTDYQKQELKKIDIYTKINQP